MSSVVPSAGDQPVVDAAVDPERYDLFRATVATHTLANTLDPVFTTDVDPDLLWGDYLAAFHDPVRRQYYSCQVCRHFIQRYGGLVRISPSGQARSAVWPGSAVGPFDAFVVVAQRRIAAARVTGVFRWDQRNKIWGCPENVGKTGTWTHLYADPGQLPPTVAGKTAGQVMAERKEDYRLLSEGLAAYDTAVLAQAVRVLEADAVARAEKADGRARWLMDVQALRTAAATRAAKENVVWAAVAAAPPGFCHISTWVGASLLDDIKAGLPVDVIAKKWADKMHPLRYQRPTAAPSAGQVAAAERRVADLEIAPALARRWATRADIPAGVALWTPPPVPEPVVLPPAGVFGHLLPKTLGVTPVELPTATVTWAKFKRDVLPRAIAVDVRVPTGRAGFYGLTTAVDAAAPPLYQWDGLVDRPRNPVAWFFYHNGSAASQWGLTPDAWAEVAMILPGPAHWQDAARFKHQKEMVLFVLPAAIHAAESELAIFPESVRADLHDVRTVIAAHSRSRRLAGRAAGDANGIAIEATDRRSGFTIRVRSAGGLATYVVDRWE